ncbi:MAG: adenylate cyclase [Solirubrobacteraceae bacterium]|nr:adenylate cyclase [Solirubrobacteraceae bacterium]
MGTPDFNAEGLLDGIEGEDRKARLQLLEQLHDAGVPLEELKQAVAEERLALVPVELVLGAEGKYTAAEVAERAGLDPEYLRRERLALGLPVPGDDAAVYTDEDVEAARRAARFLEAGMNVEGSVDAARVIGEAMSRVAATVRSLVGQSLARPGDTERDLGLRYAEATRATAPLVGPMLEYVLHQHVREQLRTDVITRSEIASGEVLPGSRDVAVCFADLVGFTRLGAEIPAEELGAVAGRLAELATETATSPVRLVKTIGDAAMLVSPEPRPLLDAALGLVTAVESEGDDFPLVRAGVASGSAISRGGDFYGHPVNLASRVTGIARPSSVLVSEDVHEAAPDDYQWSFAGEHRLKGIDGRVRLFRARHLPTDDEEATR